MLEDLLTYQKKLRIKNAVKIFKIMIIIAWFIIICFNNILIKKIYKVYKMLIWNILKNNQNINFNLMREFYVMEK